MSIIHEALKKAGQQVIADNGRSRAVRPSPAPQAPAYPPIEQPRSRTTHAGWVPFLVLGVLASVAAPLVAPRFFHTAPALEPRTVSAGREVAPDLRAQFGVEETPAVAPWPILPRPAQTVPQVPYRLTGVVYSKAASYCLLNKKVLMEGEQVDGAIVESITPKQVILNAGGEKITVPVTNG